MITAQRARELRAVIEKAVQTLEMGNAEALAAAELFPRWDAGKAFTVGERVQYGGRLWECVQAHSSQTDWTPPAAVSLWSEVKVDPETGLDEWKQPTGAHDAYNTGDRVLYKGEVYESLINGNTWAPDAYPQGWKKVEQ